MNDNLCTVCGWAELRHPGTHAFKPNPLQIKIQALEARLGRAEKLLKIVIEELRTCWDENPTKNELRIYTEAQAFLSEGGE